MFKTPFLSKNWLAANEDFETSNWVLVGIPFDGTCSYRPGTRFASEQIRLASREIEEYSPIQNRELDEVLFYDAGELDLPTGNKDKVLDLIYQATKEVLNNDKKWFGIGGEHLVSYPTLKAYKEKYPDIMLVHFDAHADLREEYLGEKFSHATVVRRIVDEIGKENLLQFGIRSGTKEEFDWMKRNNTLVKSIEEAKVRINKIKNRPIFITVDADVLDSSECPGTGTPEAGGMNYKELINYLLMFKGCNIVGCDLVEVSPPFDPSGISVAIATKLIREMFLIADTEL